MRSVLSSAMLKLALFSHLVLFAVCAVEAQQARYQLGKQVIGFETEFQNHLKDVEGRKAVLQPLEKAVQSFFRLALLDAEKSIDDAWVNLQPKESQSKLKALVPLRLKLDQHWIDVAQEELPFEINAAYESKEAVVYPIKLDVSISNSQGEVIRKSSFEIESLPYKGKIDVKSVEEGDWHIGVSLARDEVQWKLPTQIVSRTKSLEDRYVAIKQKVEGFKGEAKTTAIRTSQLNVNLLRDLKNGRVLETDYPSHRILQSLENQLDAVGGEQGGVRIGEAGQYWLELQGKSRSTVIRVSVPERKSTEEKLPVLFAFHGAGGSENMFFDAYGAGEIVRLAAQSGCLLVCPRQPLLGGMLSIEEMLDQLQDCVQIDRERVVALGHSMGAAQTIAQTEGAKLGSLKGAVILGGGRRIGKQDAWEGLPVFAAAGDRDFGRGGVEQFAESAKRAGATVKSEIYDSVEHLGIVQVALADVFLWMKPLLEK
ncbi:MAG: hypothetical protein RLY14_2792 [Planctomycetota bacterium]